MRKGICLLGSTGSIGVQTLEVLEHLKEEFFVVALCARSNLDLLMDQVRKYSPKIVCCLDEGNAQVLKDTFPKITVYSKEKDLSEVVAHDEVDIVVNALVGTVGIAPSYYALKAKKQLALANKEALVSAGKLLSDLAKQNNVPILPIDSEHSAILQCLEGKKAEEVNRLILTASGGPFFKTPKQMLPLVGLEQALKHPTWKMGKKITIDSSTLMNKGFEVIEAVWLFNLPHDKISVLVHPQSIVHSMVEFKNTSILAQMSTNDMRLPIQYALQYPQKAPSLVEPLDLVKKSPLEFFEADTEKFPCLQMAYDALKQGKGFSCYLNAANEVLVDRFLKEEFLSWMDISRKLEKLLNRFQGEADESLEAILEIDKQGRKDAQTI